MKTARSFLGGIIDYAGLFPPARLGMNEAVREFATYANGDNRDLLGRFIVPASRLVEFADAARHTVREQNQTWRLSSILAPGNQPDVQAIVHFNEEHARAGEGVVVDTIEMPVTTPADIDWAASSFGDGFAIFLEPAKVDDPAPLLERIAKAGANAKLRTGGVVADAIPSATYVMRFIDTCAHLTLPFKATAGLHHAMRGDYALTYEPGAPAGTMFGYLNIFLVAAFHRAGLPEPALFDLLEEKDASSITFDESGAWWRGNLADVSHLSATRNCLAVSFGSCSFTEPVDEARRMNII